MLLEIVARGPTTDLDRRIAMLAEVLKCRPEDIGRAAVDYKEQLQLRSRLFNFLIEVANAMG